MKKLLIAFAFLIHFVFLKTTAMQVPGSLKIMPPEIKLKIVEGLLGQNSIQDVFYSLHSIRLVDQEFYDYLTHESFFRPFFALASLPDNSNIFNVFALLKANPILLQYPDLSQYLHTKFSYLPPEIIQGGLMIFNNEVRTQILNTLHEVGYENLNDALPYFLSGETREDLLKNMIFIFQLLLLNQLDVHGKSYEGTTPLMAAISKNNFIIAKLLLEKGANVNEKTPNGDTPLALSIFPPTGLVDLNLVRLLLIYGANPNITINGIPLVLYAARAKNAQLIQFLIDYGADVSPTMINNYKNFIQSLPGLSDEVIRILYNASGFLENYLNYISEEPIKLD